MFRSLLALTIVAAICAAQAKAQTFTETPNNGVYSFVYNSQTWYFSPGLSDVNGGVGSFYVNSQSVAGDDAYWQSQEATGVPDSLEGGATWMNDTGGPEKSGYGGWITPQLDPQGNNIVIAYDPNGNATGSSAWENASGGGMFGYTPPTPPTHVNGFTAMGGTSITHNALSGIASKIGPIIGICIGFFAALLAVAALWGWVAATFLPKSAKQIEAEFSAALKADAESRKDAEMDAGYAEAAEEQELRDAWDNLQPDEDDNDDETIDQLLSDTAAEDDEEQDDEELPDTDEDDDDLSDEVDDYPDDMDDTEGPDDDDAIDWDAYETACREDDEATRADWENPGDDEELDECDEAELEEVPF